MSTMSYDKNVGFDNTKMENMGGKTAQLGSIANWDKVCFLYILKARFLSLHSQLVSDSSLVEYTFNNLYKFEISDEILTIYVIVRTETVSKLTFVDLKI